MEGGLTQITATMETRHLVAVKCDLLMTDMYVDLSTKYKLCTVSANSHSLQCIAGELHAQYRFAKIIDMPAAR